MHSTETISTDIIFLGGPLYSKSPTFQNPLSLFSKIQRGQIQNPSHRRRRRPPREGRRGHSDLHGLPSSPAAAAGDRHAKKKRGELRSPRPPPLLPPSPSSVLHEDSPDEVAEPPGVELGVDGGDGGGISLQGLVRVLELLADVVVLQDVDDPEVEDRLEAPPALPPLLRPRRHVRPQPNQWPSGSPTTNSKGKNRGATNSKIIGRDHEIQEIQEIPISWLEGGSDSRGREYRPSSTQSASSEPLTESLMPGMEIKLGDSE